jgi:hypothetical protein
MWTRGTAERGWSVSEDVVRGAIQLLRCARDNIEHAIDNLIDAVISKQREVYIKHAAKLAEAAIVELNEFLKLVKKVEPGAEQ